MINKEDFIKKFPFKEKCCTADYICANTCVIDEGRREDCLIATKNGMMTKEDCKYWENIPNWRYVEDVWKWINSYQQRGQNE